MDLLKFLFSRKFVKHLAIALIITLALIWGGLSLMSWYTGHNEHLAVPDFRGKLISTVMKGSMYADFRFVVIDSVYDPGRLPGTIMHQDPWMDSRVKKNRQIYVTVSSVIPDMVTMPDLKYLTLRQASSMLESYGLRAGTMTYAPAFDKDAVQQQMYQNLPIEPGTRIYKGSVIDLVIGAGSGIYEMPAGDSIWSDTLGENTDEYVNF